MEIPTDVKGDHSAATGVLIILGIVVVDITFICMYFAVVPSVIIFVKGKYHKHIQLFTEFQDMSIDVSP